MQSCSGCKRRDGEDQKALATPNRPLVVIRWHVKQVHVLHKLHGSVRKLALSADWAMQVTLN